MQTSSREEDWTAFQLHDESEDLKEIFTNPNIVKTGLIPIPVTAVSDLCQDYMVQQVTLFVLQ